MRTLWLFSMFHLHWTRIEKKTGLKQKKDIVYLTHVVSLSNYKENDVLLMIITVHILVQTTSSRLTSMNNIREKKIDFFSPHRSITMISYVQSFICTYILIYRKYRTISASCLWFVTHYYFSLSLLFFLSLSLLLSVILSAIAQHYQQLQFKIQLIRCWLVTIASTWIHTYVNTSFLQTFFFHVRRTFFTFKLFS